MEIYKEGKEIMYLGATDIQDVFWKVLQQANTSKYNEYNTVDKTAVLYNYHDTIKRTWLQILINPIGLTIEQVQDAGNAAIANGKISVAQWNDFVKEGVVPVATPSTGQKLLDLFNQGIVKYNEYSDLYRRYKGGEDISSIISGKRPTTKSNTTKYLIIGGAALAIILGGVILMKKRSK